MVVSNINPNVNYVEKKILDEEDIGHQSSLYVIDIFDMPILIVLGKQKYTYANKDILYYPIYVVSNDKIKSQIGVFETRISNTLSLIDEDGDIDIEKMGEPLIYSFVTKKYLEKSNSNANIYIDDKIEHKKEEDNIKIEESSDDETDDESDVMKLKVSNKKVSEEKQKTDKIIEDGIFDIDTSFKQPALLKEEIESDADKIKIDYRESSKNEWIEKFMKNNNYKIKDNEGMGDCFFAVIRDAFAEIGQKTTVSKLRALLSSNVTDEVYQENRKLYTDFEYQISELTKELKNIKKANDVYAQRIKKLNDKVEIEKILQETKQLKELYSSKMKELKETKKLQDTYIGYMKDIDTIEKYRAYILTSNYWADTWAISTLEELLKIKFIIFSEESFKEKYYDNVLNCGEINKNIEKTSTFEPKYYIMTSYSGNHYKLISYKNKSILTFNEIPYDVKILIVNKCLEKNSGIYYLIQDFKNLKSKLGLNPDEGNPNDEDDSEDDLYSDLYTKSVIFVFHSKSLDTAKPGKGASETIDKDRVNEFAVLTKIDNWRRKLDDMWNESPFVIDRHKWSSVEHYIQASKFKKGFPEFYEQFSLDKPSELSKDPELAKLVGDISKSKYKELRPQNVKIDVDYNLGRDVEEREEALRAKFAQNEDLKQLLLLTKNALLKRSLRRKPAEIDMLLMKIRNELK
jgi:predicted NAD-dependent protein-ADP-ribosyltransferase YbiA (DUF1768 family)